MNAISLTTNVPSARQLERRKEMLSYTAISEGIDAPSAAVVDSVLDALKLAEFEARESNGMVTIAAENSGILTLDEPEDIVHQ
ncbi:hypothetical protein [Chenggangzhangella methanolivorans]|uniref:Uncharacterized protein n=1 Tax=Chenggangzhangella methanolivorans TaxID=1437009 RepID=A0A9E6RIH8_9HYPH|nr:hypothetical protein [Chenggangzhangella methanolivorans]QZO02091.1 hypothetical protein K6K41_12945 [Chenggangzhangella methanolivorans]